MKISLSVEVPVERFAAFAELAWLERRPELGLLCRAARDGGSRRISADTVAAVLPGLTPAGAHNIARWCEALGLCDAAGGLTGLGEDVAQTDEAPVPEQGVYDLWLARHPLIGNRLLAVERLASRRDGRFELVEPLAHPPDRGVVFRSTHDPRERFVLRSFPVNHDQVGVLRRDTQATCRIRWMLDSTAERDRWQLDGRIERAGSLVSIQHEPELSGLDPWALVEHWATGPLARHGRWDPRARRLAVPFEGLAVAEQDRFARTLTLGPVEVPGKGRHAEAKLEDVPLGPASAADAQRWAMARLWRRLAHQPRYRSRGDVRALFVSLCEGTPLEPYMPTLPPHAELVDGELLAREPEVFWSLVAPVDLAPTLPTAEQLDALRIGAQR